MCGSSLYHGRQQAVPSDVLPLDRSHLPGFPEPLAGEEARNVHGAFLPPQPCYASPWVSKFPTRKVFARDIRVPGSFVPHGLLLGKEKTRVKKGKVGCGKYCITASFGQMVLSVLEYWSQTDSPRWTRHRMVEIEI